MAKICHLAAYFENTTPGHNKCYFVSVIEDIDPTRATEYFVESAWGRIGSPGMSKGSERCYRQSHAYAIATEKINKRREHGYDLVWQYTKDSTTNRMYPEKLDSLPTPPWFYDLFQCHKGQFLSSQGQNTSPTPPTPSRSNEPIFDQRKNAPWRF